MLRSRFALLLLACSLSGCYAYLPSSPQEASPGETVRLRVTADEATKYLDLNLSNPRLLEGTLIDRGDGTLVVEASVGSNDPTRGSRALVQRVAVPLEGILDVERKEMDRTKTGLLIGGGAAALAVVIAQGISGSGSKDGPGTDVPEARRIPLLRFSLPFGR
jgi:hypothetical protein